LIHRRRFVSTLSAATVLGLSRYPNADAEPVKHVKQCSRSAALTEHTCATDKAGLFIGVSDYRVLPVLPSAVRDARAVAKSCANLGVQSRLLLNPTLDELLLGLAAFAHFAKNAKLAILYVAAHGVVREGSQFVVPVDAGLDDIGRGYRMLPEHLLMSALRHRPMQRVVFFDACREAGPVNHSVLPKYPIRERTDYKAENGGNYVLYAAQPGAPAFDAVELHGPFAHALIKALRVPGLELNALSRRVRTDVIQQTQGLQVPWSRSSLMSPVILNSKTT